MSALLDPFKDVPMNDEDSWRTVEKIAFDAIYLCGHPRGGCPYCCDPLVKIFDIARQRLRGAVIHERVVVSNDVQVP